MYRNGAEEEAGHKAPAPSLKKTFGVDNSVVFRELLAFSELLPALPSHLEGR